MLKFSLLISRWKILKNSKTLSLSFYFIFSGISLALAFRLEFLWLSFFSLVPVFVLLDSDFVLSRRGLKKVFWYTLLFNLSFNFVGFNFMLYTFREFSHFPLLVRILFFLLFSALNSFWILFLMLGIFGLKSVFKNRFKNQVYILLGGFCLFFAEVLDYKLFPFKLGNILVSDSILSILIKFLFVDGASLVVYFASFFVYQIIFKKRFVGAIFYFSVIYVFSLVLLGFSKKDDKGSNPHLSFSYIQGNIGNSAKLEIERKLELQKIYGKSHEESFLILKRYVDLSKKVLSLGDVVIWPETAYPSIFTSSSFSYHAFKGKSEFSFLVKELYRLSFKKPFIFGAYSFEDSLLANAIVFLSSGKAVIYIKRHLLPFGEYMPFGDVFPVLYRWFEDVSHFAFGKDVIVFKVGRFKILPLICYEILYRTDVRKLVKEFSPDYIVNISNDSWFSYSGAKAHLFLARAVSLETGIPIVRVTNTGISAYIDSWGRIRFFTRYGSLSYGRMGY